MSKELAKTYDPKGMEDRLYKKWIDNRYFHAEVDKSKKPFSIVMPPPNITGKLHMGHAFDNTMQDIITRFKRMQGYNTLWQPGTDHASIATEVKIIEKLREEGIEVPRKSLGMEERIRRDNRQPAQKRWEYPATGKERDLQWTRAATMQSTRSFCGYIKRVLFTRETR